MFKVYFSKAFYENVELITFLKKITNKVRNAFRFNDEDNLDQVSFVGVQLVIRSI